MKKTFNIAEDFEEYHKYFKEKYQKVLYDLMLCELLEIQYIAKENDIDIKRLVNTIIKFNVDMEAVIALIYQIHDPSLSAQTNVQKELVKKKYIAKENEIQDENPSELFTMDLSSDGEEN
jgi:hypothetical protein